jgi:hypothetical protein
VVARALDDSPTISKVVNTRSAAMGSFVPAEELESLYRRVAGDRADVARASGGYSTVKLDR